MNVGRLLIVEDCPNDRAAIEEVIGDKYAVRYAETLTQAEEMMKDEPDAVLLDVRLPGPEDEAEVLRRIKALRKNAAIIIVSGFLTPERIEQYISGTASGCCSKAHIKELLLHQIQQGIANHRGCRNLDEARKNVTN